MKKQQGFTLIELIMVIVILGILAAFAIPKFANLGADARRSTMQGVEGAMKSASAISHAAWLANGTNPASVTLEGASVAMFNGYPSPVGIVVAANITGGAAATDAGDFIVLTNATTTTVRAKGATTPASCQVVYTRSAAANPPVITSTLTNCTKNSRWSYGTKHGCSFLSASFTGPNFQPSRRFSSSHELCDASGPASGCSTWNCTPLIADWRCHSGA